MTLPGTALSPAQLRRLAVGMVEEDGDAPDAVAAFLEVSERSVWRWLAAWRRRGDVGLLTRPGQGRPPKLTGRQERQVLGWLGKSACKFGFLTERWTAPRVAALMAERLGVQMNRRYLSAWLACRGISPQVPQPVPRERDDEAIRRWVAGEWPLIKKRRPTAAPPSHLPTRAGSCCCRWSAARSRRGAARRCCRSAAGTGTGSRRPPR